METPREAASQNRLITQVVVVELRTLGLQVLCQ